MAVDNSFLIRSIQKKKSLIAAYCGFTNMPLVVCDPETFNDQVFLFDTEAQLKEFAKPYIDKKIAIRGMKYDNKGFLPFFSMLFQIGVNELVFVSSRGRDAIELTQLVKRPDFSKIPKEQQPVMNPELQLTGLYFMQQAARPVPPEEKEDLPDLEEELSANLVRARYIVPVELMEGPESDAKKLQERKYRIPVVKNKNGDLWQPVFTDPFEMAKFNRDKKLRALAFPYDALTKSLAPESKGFIVNPNGFHIFLSRELMQGIADRFDATSVRNIDQMVKADAKAEQDKLANGPKPVFQL